MARLKLIYLGVVFALCAWLWVDGKRRDATVLAVTGVGGFVAGMK